MGSDNIGDDDDDGDLEAELAALTQGTHSSRQKKG